MTSKNINDTGLIKQSFVHVYVNIEEDYAVDMPAGLLTEQSGAFRSMLWTSS